MEKMKDLKLLCRPVLLFFVLINLSPTAHSITTIHHNKPHDASIPIMASNMKKYQQQKQHLNGTLAPSERQKRLLPYMNFYTRQNFNQPQHQQPIRQHQLNNAQRYRILATKPNNYEPLIRKFNDIAGNNYRLQPIRQEKIRLTPFTDTNALPGPFLPMKSPYETYQPNFSEIYDKLVQLKYAQQIEQPQQIPYNQQYQPQYEPQKQRILNYVPNRNYQEAQPNIVEPAKTVVQTYTATEVDVPPQPLEYQQYDQNIQRQKPIYPVQRPIQIIEVINPQNDNKQVQLPRELIGKPIFILAPKPLPQQQTNLEVVQQQKNDEKQRIFEEQLRIYEDQQTIFRNEQKIFAEEEQRKIAEERRKYNHQPRKPIIYNQNIQLQPNLENHRYVAIQEYQPPPQKYQQHIPEVITPQKLQFVPAPSYTPVVPIQNKHPETITVYPATTEHRQYPVGESAGNLANLLKKLQDSNTLPQNLTPENVDNSIRTLVKILSFLKKHQRLSKRPIIVPDRPEDIENNEADAKFKQPNDEEIPGTITQNFPAIDTVEGGTPGTPGVDYPALSTIPQTSFNCKTQRYKGFFGDPDTNCQVWHYCDFNGGQASFLCPNGTIFSQVALTCDWWYNVKCATTPQLYVLNERLYKYILPFSPKFPEDYSGPLVDRYLALKFQEMEEKMKKQRDKSKESNDEDNSEEQDKQEYTEKESEEIDDADQLQQKNEENRQFGNSEEHIDTNNVKREIT